MILNISFVLIGLATLLTIIRLLRGPSSFDRLIASDMLAIISSAFLAIYSASARSIFFIDVAVVNIVIGFIGVVIIARFLQGVAK